MADDFIPLYDFPDHFYYDDLSSALKDLRLSPDGIHRIISKLPLSDKSDRKVLPHLLIRMIADAQKPAKVIDVVWEHSVARFLDLGFTQKAIQEFSTSAPITNPADRELLLNVLTRWLVRNESMVPRGYPGHLKLRWKQNQLERHRSST